jgi:hypothetical protein
MAKRIKQLRQPSSGSLSFIEGQNGQLTIRLSMDEQEGTEDFILKRIQAAIAGLAYHYERNADEIDSIGLAFLDGMKIGQGSMAQPEPEKKKKKTHYGKSTIGFGADV